MSTNESLRDYLQELYDMAIHNERLCREEVEYIDGLQTQKASLKAKIRLHEEHKEQLYRALKLLDEQELASSEEPADDPENPDGIWPDGTWPTCCDCRGSGWNSSASDICKPCKGFGRIKPDANACGMCYGSGHYADGSVCRRCGGFGSSTP